MSGLYNDDLVLWSEEQARLLREHANGRPNAPLDFENLAEEIEQLGRSQRRELESRISIILEHLMKLAASPAPEPVRGWSTTVLRERRQVASLLRDSPSLRLAVATIIREEIPPAREAALLSLDVHAEPPRVDIATLDFDEAAVLTAPLSPG
jgi:Domain of unknown function DUF29